MTDFLTVFVFVFKIYFYICISFLPFVLYYSFFESSYKPNSDFYHRKEWYHFLKFWWAKPVVKKYKKSFSNAIKQETWNNIEKPRKLTSFMRSDSQTIYGVDQKGNYLFIKLILREKRLAELCLQLRLASGKIYQLPEHPLSLFCSIPARKWEAGGLQITVCEPFTTLRINYNGLLRDVVRNDESADPGNIVHGRFSFIWSAASEAKFFPQDCTANELANAVAVEPWKDEHWIKLLGCQTGYDQFGMLLGQVALNEVDPPTILRLTGCRKRAWGPSEVRTLHRALTFFSADSQGTVFTITVKSYKGGCKELHIGNVILPNRQVFPVENCDISLPDFFEDGIIPGVFSFTFKAGSKMYKCTAFTYCDSIADMKNEEETSYKSKLVKINFLINGAESKGLGLFWYNYKGKGCELPSYIVRPGKQIIVPEKKIVASLTDPECRSEYLAGIKGTALSLLFTIKNEKFDVPDGFCILTTALERHLEENQIIKEELSKLNDICCGITEGDLIETCERVHNLFVITPLSEELTETILNKIRLLKFTHTDIETENLVKYCWAVRSSTVDEDIEKLPSLRNQTFLDCFTDDDVLRAVVKCWASIYEHPKILHRKRFGLPIICEMAVVVQYAINSEMAGVLSTVHPQSGDPSRMVITANYGLGVTVVTEMVEPDTITINRTWDSKLSILCPTSGSKTVKVIIGKNSIEKLDNFDAAKKSMCLTQSQIYQMAEVGLWVEKALSGPKIIEWAFFKDNLYLLMVKSVKSQHDWTNFDLIHENNTAVMSENEYSILNSAQNEFSGVSSILTQSICVKFLDESLQEIRSCNQRSNGAILKILTVYKQIVGSNYFEGVLKNADKEISEEMKINELVLTGQAQITERLHKEAMLRNRISNYKNSLINILRDITHCWNSEDRKHEAKFLSQAIRLNSEPDSTAAAHLKIIKRNLHLLKHIIYLHSSVTWSNIFYQKILINLMLDENSDVTSDQINEILDTYDNSNLFKVPVKIELMASLIRSKNLDGEFCKLAPEKGLKWLEENCDDVLVLLKKFMRTFGFKGLQEFDFISDPWELNTVVVIKILQLMVQKLQIEKEKDEPTTEMVKVPIVRQKMKGKILKWLETKVQNSFAYKATTATAVAVTINKFRYAYRELAKKLVHEGKLPETGLIFHLKHPEIEKIVEEKNCEVVAKAIKRSRIFQKLQQIDIPDSYFGENILYDTTLQSNNNNNNNNNEEDQPNNAVRIIGHTVYSGHVVGKACVIKNIRQITHVTPGAILVTKNLDVGWLPYFPVLSGIITETGSLTSVGAIAVRKRKIPCIIETKNATKLFQTNDTIMLIGTTGVVERIEISGPQ